MARPSISAVAELLKPITWFPPMWAFACGAISSGVSPDGQWPLFITGIVLAGLISGTFAMINSFVFNMRFTFKKQNIDTRHIVYFFLITMFGIYIIRPIILKLLTDVWVWPSQLAYSITSGIGLPFSQDFDQRNLALAVAILVVLVFNYLMYKYFVFTNNEKK